MKKFYLTEFNDQNQPVNAFTLTKIINWWQNQSDKDTSIKSYPHPNYPDQLPQTKDKVKVRDINIQGNKLTWRQYDQNMKVEIEQIELDGTKLKITVFLKSKAKLEFYY